MKYFVLVISLFIVSTTCLLSQEKVVINGTVLNNLKYSKVYLDNVLTQNALDSANVDASGKFTIETTIPGGDFYKLSLSQQHYLLLVLNPGENVNLELDLSNMYSPKITGSENSELVYSTFDKMKAFDEKQKRLTEQVEKEKIDYLRNFILNNLNSLSSLFFIESIPIKEDPELYKKLEASLTKLYPENIMVKNLQDKVKSLNNLGIGTIAPEIDLPNVEGENIKLSSLRGKYVLIDFWAAWCGPCRRESPKLVEVYNKYNSKGFEIYSVSLDRSKDAWVDAIEKDKLGAWVHVSDLKYWGSVAAKEYGVDGIPFTVLIDKEGKIIEKGLRGDKLKAKLAEIFK